MEVPTLGKYELRATRGRGAMGTVYEAWDPVISRRVAIKTVPLPDAADPETQENLARFRREAQAAGRLNHPSIVGVYDYGETDTLAFIVMEYVDGEALKSMLDRDQRFTLAEVRNIVEQFLAGLQFSHERGVVHRDIKPGNIMLTRAGAVKITDFGIARIESSSMTQTGALLGTPAYMSPEQFMGHATDARTDIYSTGALLYQLLTGARPFDGAMSAIMHKVLSGPPPRPSLTRPALAPFDAVIAKAMARQPDDRYASASAFLAAVRAAFAVPPGAAPTDPEATVLLGAPAAPSLAAAPDHPVDDGTRTSLLPVVFAGALMAFGILGGLAWYLLTPEPFAESRPPQRIAAQPPAPTPRPLPPSPPTPSPPSSPPVVRVPPVNAPPTQVLATPPLPDLPPVEHVVPTLAALRAAVGPIACTLANTQLVDDSTVFVTGLSQRGAAENALRSAVGDAAPEARIGWSVRRFDGPFCAALDALRPMRTADTHPSAALSLALKGDITRLRKDDLIALHIVMPDFPGLLQVDYLSNDGSVTHLVSDDGTNVRVMTPAGWKITGPSHRYQPGEDVTIGDPDPTTGLGTWAVDAPFGNDMIIAIVADEPLFAVPRPTDDPPETYFRDLRRVLETAATRATRLSAQALLVETVPR